MDVGTDKVERGYNDRFKLARRKGRFEGTDGNAVSKSLNREAEGRSVYLYI
jgi:hypothetical protein